MYHDCPRTHPAPHVTDRVYIGRGGVEPLLCSRCLIAWDAKAPLLVPSENQGGREVMNCSRELKMIVDRMNDLAELLRLRGNEHDTATVIYALSGRIYAIADDLEVDDGQSALEQAGFGGEMVRNHIRADGIDPK